MNPPWYRRVMCWLFGHDRWGIGQPRIIITPQWRMLVFWHCPMCGRLQQADRFGR